MATYTYAVTVQSTTNGNRYYIGSRKNPVLHLSAGDTINFTLMDSSLGGGSSSGHPFGIGASNSASGAYGSTDGVTYDIDGTTYNTFTAFQSQFQSAAPSTSCSLSYVVPTGTPEFLYYFCGNHSNMGNFMEITGRSGSYDSTAPTITSITLNNGDSTTYKRSLQATILCKDNANGGEGVQGYFLSESSTTPSISDFIQIPVVPAATLSGSDQTINVPFICSATAEAKIIYCWVIDKTNNISAFATDTIDLAADNINGIWDAPTGNYVYIQSDVPQTAVRQVTLSISGTAGSSANINGYLIRETQEQPLDGSNDFDTSDSAWVALTATASYSNASISYTFDADKEQKYIFIYFKDANSQISPPITARILYDPAYGSGTDPFATITGGQLFSLGYSGDGMLGGEDDHEYITVPYPVIMP